MSGPVETEAAMALLAARDALAESLTSTREALATITTSLAAMPTVEVSAVAVLVAKANELGRLLTGRVRETVAIFADLDPSPSTIEELARAGATLEAGEAAIYRSGCVELYIHLLPAPAKEG